MLRVFPCGKFNPLDWVLFVFFKHWVVVKPYNLKLLSFETLLTPECPCLNWNVVWNVIHCLSLPNLNLWKSYRPEDARKTARENTANNCSMHRQNVWILSPDLTIQENNMPLRRVPSTVKRVLKIYGIPCLHSTAPSYLQLFVDTKKASSG